MVAFVLVTCHSLYFKRGITTPGCAFWKSIEWRTDEATRGSLSFVLSWFVHCYLVGCIYKATWLWLANVSSASVQPGMWSFEVRPTVSFSTCTMWCISRLPPPLKRRPFRYISFEVFKLSVFWSMGVGKLGRLCGLWVSDLPCFTIRKNRTKLGKSLFSYR